MKFHNYSLFLLLTLAVLLFSSFPMVKGEFNFTYRNSSPENPFEWGHLHKEWEICGFGHRQSPIDLTDDRKLEIQKHFIDLGRHYNSSNATLINRGPDLMLKFDNPVGGFYHSGTEFFLRQLHYHKPSEHTINKHRYALEMHMVHTSNDNHTAVIGFLYKYGDPDPFLTQLKPFIKAVSGKEGLKVEVGIINPNELEEKYHGYYRYMGSLTTPPCTEGIIWTVMKEVRTVSRKQVDMLKAATPGYDVNSRPTQNTDTRHIKFYKP